MTALDRAHYDAQRKTERSLWLGKRGPLAGMVSQHRGWLRLFGYGVSWASVVHPPIFSERNGFYHMLRIGPWRFRLLWRNE